MSNYHSNHLVLLFWPYPVPLGIFLMWASWCLSTHLLSCVIIVISYHLCVWSFLGNSRFYLLPYYTFTYLTNSPTHYLITSYSTLIPNSFSCPSPSPFWFPSHLLVSCLHEHRQLFYCLKIPSPSPSQSPWYLFLIMMLMQSCYPKPNLLVFIYLRKRSL